MRTIAVADSEASTTSTVSLDQLVALNDEVAALVRSGVPLEQGLGEPGGDMSRRLGQFVTLFAERMLRGEALGEVLRHESDQIPPVYRAVVEAGLWAGRLAAALESVSRSARRLVEIRRIVAASVLYPLIVFLVGWGLFCFFLPRNSPPVACIA